MTFEFPSEPEVGSFMFARKQNESPQTDHAQSLPRRLSRSPGASVTPTSKKSLTWNLLQLREKMCHEKTEREVTHSVGEKRGTRRRGGTEAGSGLGKGP